jgi:hypothetical protein
MKPLEQLPLWQRVLIALLIILVIALIVFFTEAESQQLPAPAERTAYDAHLVELDKQALELAYTDQVRLLFSVWLRDDIKVVERVTKGLGIARRAYAHAAQEIDRRERELQR